MDLIARLVLLEGLKIWQRKSLERSPRGPTERGQHHTMDDNATEHGRTVSIFRHEAVFRHYSQYGVCLSSSSLTAPQQKQEELCSPQSTEAQSSEKSSFCKEVARLQQGLAYSDRHAPSFF